MKGTPLAPSDASPPSPSSARDGDESVAPPQQEMQAPENAALPVDSGAEEQAQDRPSVGWRLRELLIGRGFPVLRLLVLLAILWAAVAQLLQGQGTLALFTDVASSTGNTFITAEVTLGDAPTSAAITFSNLLPSDKVTDDIVVSNSGTITLRYALEGTATNADSKDLRAQLDLTIKVGVTTCTTAGFDTDGTEVYGTDLPLGSAGTTQFFGDKATGSDSGDRTVAASGSETLCFQITLPSSTGTAYENATTTATFTFYAEQT